MPNPISPPNPNPNAQPTKSDGVVSAADEEDSCAPYIDIQVQSDLWHDWVAPIESWLGASLRALNMAHGEISVYLTDDAECAVYNERYRGRASPTNVLSFPATSAASIPSGASMPMDDAVPPILWGDILLAYETIEREAGAQGKSLQAHIAHLLIHGLLHLKGYDHQTDDEAEDMEAQEIATLAQLGFANPYVVKPSEC